MLFYSQIFKYQPNHCKEVRENTIRIFKYFIKPLSVFFYIFIYIYLIIYTKVYQNSVMKIFQNIYTCDLTWVNVKDELRWWLDQVKVAITLVYHQTQDKGLMDKGKVKNTVSGITHASLVHPEDAQ